MILRKEGGSGQLGHIRKADPAEQIPTWLDFAVNQSMTIHYSTHS